MSHSSLDELSPAYYGLKCEEKVRPQGILNAPMEKTIATTTVEELEKLLKDIYCGKAVSAEFAYVEVSSIV